MLCEDIHKEVAIRGIIEVPAMYDEAVYRNLATKWATGEADVLAKAFSDEAWKSTFNKDDLKPDVVTKMLNKVFVWNEGENRFKVNVEAATAGKAGFLGIGAEASLKGSYTKEELKKFLQKHDVTVAFEGTMIIPKSLLVLQLNVGDFKNTSKFTSETLLVSGPTKRSEPGQLDLKVFGSSGYPDLPARLAMAQVEIKKLTSDLNKLASDTKQQIATAMELEKKLETSQLKVDYFEQIWSTNGLNRGDKDIPSNQELSWNVPGKTWGTKVIAAICTPTDVVNEITTFSRLSVEPDGNQIKVKARANPNRKILIRMRFFVFYQP